MLSVRDYIQPIKDILGLTEAVEEMKTYLEDEYSNYPAGIEKIRLHPHDPARDFVEVHLEDRIDFYLMEEVAEEMGVQTEIRDQWMGFFTHREIGGHHIKNMKGHIRKEKSVPISLSDVKHGGYQVFRFNVLVSYLERRYGSDEG